MQAAEVFLKIKERLNKLDSSDYDNLQCWQVREAYNKAQIEWVRRQVRGKNQLQESDEESRGAIDDLQRLLVFEKVLQGSNKKLYFDSELFPSDYLYFKRLTPIVRKGKCKGVPILSKLRQEANVDELLYDSATQPSFQFEETFHTISGNSFKVFTLGDFQVESIKLTYYRLPKALDFDNCEHIDGTQGTRQDPEFSNDVVEIIIDNAVSILAGDIESPNQVEINKQRSEINN